MTSMDDCSLVRMEILFSCLRQGIVVMMIVVMMIVIMMIVIQRLSGRYWSGELFENNSAFDMVFSNYILDWDKNICNNRCSVRPVKKFLLP